MDTGVVRMLPGILWMKQAKLLLLAPRILSSKLILFTREQNEKFDACAT
jgi:hypothetical protein